MSDGYVDLTCPACGYSKWQARYVQARKEWRILKWIIDKAQPAYLRLRCVTCGYTTWCKPIDIRQKPKEK